MFAVSTQQYSPQIWQKTSNLQQVKEKKLNSIKQKYRWPLSKKYICILQLFAYFWRIFEAVVEFSAVVL